MYVGDAPLDRADPTGLYDCNDKASCAAGETVRNGLLAAQAHFKSGSEAFEKLQGSLNTLGTQNDHNNLTVIARTNSHGDTAVGRGSWDAKTGHGSLTINLNNINTPGASNFQNYANLVATGAHELKHISDNKENGGPPRTPSDEFWHEVRGVRAETPVWEGLGVADPMWKTWTPGGGLDMHQVNKEAKTSTDDYCPNGVCF